MLIIKPYGRSHTEFESEGKLRRKIRLDRDIGTAHDEPVDVGRFTKPIPNSSSRNGSPPSTRLRPNPAATTSQRSNSAPSANGSAKWPSNS